jgi:hypothetical protein
MKGLRIAIAFGVVALAMAIGFSARADTFNKLSVLTFSQPVELPGNVTLPAGTYAFKLMDTFGYRHIVQVFNKDRTQVFATILAIPNYRVEPTDKTYVITSDRRKLDVRTRAGYYWPSRAQTSSRGLAGAVR